MRNHHRTNTLGVLLALICIITPVLTRDYEMEHHIGNKLKDLLNDQSKIRKVDCEEGGLESLLFY